ncbi:MAG: hypothetical protein NDJ92_11760 [Thermoanaerobaculia bacterium]|nr:hypothetical protein [Thermoanaerobaculia bacterium]
MPLTRVLGMAFALGLPAFSTAFALPMSFKAEPIEFALVDKDSGRPIEGATAAAIWQYRAGMEGGGNGPIVNVLEMVTGKDGKVRFPGWGPVIVTARLRETTVYIFKSGYAPEYANNEPTLSSSENDRQQRFLYNGLAVRMTQVSGSRKDYVLRVERLSDSLMSRARTLGMPGARSDCEWKRFPLMIKALMEEESRFKVEGIAMGLIPSKLKVAEEHYVKVGCGSPTAFLEGLK